jgi:RNA polymerase sigma-70 factor (ECF subfamily)
VTPSRAPGPPDEDLLRAASDGDEAAFLRIYERHRDRVYRFAYRMTGSKELADDVTHSCFLSLLQAPARYDARRAALGTYLCAAARHLSLRHASRAWRERPGGSLRRDAAPGGGASPLDALLESERAHLVREAVLALAPLHREVLVLVEYEELDLATVAAIVGAGVGAVKVRLHRARRKLRALLEPRVRDGALAVK